MNALSNGSEFILIFETRAFTRKAKLRRMSRGGGAGNWARQTIARLAIYQPALKREDNEDLAATSENDTKRGKKPRSLLPT